MTVIREGKLPTGKGMFLWILHRLCDGDMLKLAEQLHRENYQWVCVKVVEGRLTFDPYPREKDIPSQQELLTILAPCLENYGIELHLWGFYYGSTWSLRDNTPYEIERTLEQIAKWRPKSFMVNAETHFKRSKSRTRARDLLAGIKTGMAGANDSIPDIPIGLSSFKFPTSHPEMPWDIFGQYADYWSPQVYWVAAHNPASQLERSIQQHKDIADLPMIPAGSAYPDSSYRWKPSVSELREFNDAVQEKYPGILYWEYHYIEDEPSWQDEIASHVWEDAPEQPEPTPNKWNEALESVEKYIEGIKT